MKVSDLIKELKTLNEEAEVMIYSSETGEPVSPNKIAVEDNDGDTPIVYHIYHVGSDL